MPLYVETNGPMSHLKLQFTAITNNTCLYNTTQLHENQQLKTKYIADWSLQQNEHT